MIVCECVRECRARWWRFQVAIKINCHGVGVCLFYRSIEHGQVSGQCNEGIWLSGCGLSWLTIRLSRLLLATCSQRANFSDIIFNWATTHTFFAAPCAPRVMHHAERRTKHTHTLSFAAGEEGWQHFCRLQIVQSPFVMRASEHENCLLSGSLPTQLM
jgi:hypothetical protein